MTPETLVNALRLHMPHTEILLGDKPGKVIVKMAGKPWPLDIYIILSKKGKVVYVGTEDVVQIHDGWRLSVDEVVKSIELQVDNLTVANKPYQRQIVESRLRAWGRLPDMPVRVKHRARALRIRDRNLIAEIQAGWAGLDGNTVPEEPTTQQE